MTRVFRRFPLASYFIVAFAGTWLVVLPLILGKSGLGLVSFDPPALPFLTLGAIAGPALGALLVTHAETGMDGVRRLLRRCGLWRVGFWWYVLILTGSFLILTLSAAMFSLS